METEELIPAPLFCTHYNIELSFIDSLRDYGLIELTSNQETYFIHKEQIREIEKMIHLHYDLDINLEGIDAIAHMLRRMNELQSEVRALRNKLGA
jgi:chaperone modulatory protein CbpM